MQDFQVDSELFQLLVTSVKDYGIFMLDTGGVIRTWNAGAERIKGYTAKEIIGKHFSTFYPPEDIANGKPEMELRVASKEGRFEDIGWRVRKDGTRFWANVVITAVFDQSGLLRGFAKVTRDLTEQKLVEEERKLRDAAQAANEAKSRFLAGMSHELRTPLNSIIGFVGVLLMELPGPLNEDQTKQLQQVNQSARHLLSLINDILNLSRVEAGKADVVLEPLSCRKFIDDALSSLRIQVEAKNLKLTEDVPDVYVLADARAFKQILLNLITNAIKFTLKGSIEIAARKEHNGIAVSVSDTGIGISRADQLKLFQPFGQIDHDRRHEGSGLGLHLSQKLVESMQGRIDVRSEVGRGSVFTVYLPEAPHG